MARYAISQDGIDNLARLSIRLVQATDGIDEACNILYQKIERLEPALGGYYLSILKCSREIFVAYKQGREQVDYLANIAIPNQISKIERLITAGIKPSGDADDTPSQKTLILHK